ncbi:MAG: serine/threonine protein kinase [Polyangiaceae bacterium]|nr:serine/threonine protein kinase [Polyangiaceae bacterium]
MPEPASLPERIGRYEIRGNLGSGAMGRVLQAFDPVLGREVAIKMLRTDLDISPEMRTSLLRRMRHEARAVARVAHPNIVTLHDMIDDTELGVCLVFEFVSGHTLKDRVSEGPTPPLQVARIAREIGSALTLAHKADVLHRDVKPDNIMLAPYGAKIADFGIARVPDSTLTRVGGLLGTPAYSAPECISGSSFSAASDQFSLAATLYEAISGARAFPGDDAVTVAARIGIDEPKPIAQSLRLDARVDQVLGRAFSKDPARRFATCDAFGEALAAALEIGTMLEGGKPVANVAPPPAAETRPLSLWLSVGLGGVAVGAMVAILAVSLLQPPAPSAFDLVAARSAAAASATAPAARPELAPPSTRTHRAKPEPTQAPARVVPDEQERNTAAVNPEQTDPADAGTSPTDSGAREASTTPDSAPDPARPSPIRSAP